MVTNREFCSLSDYAKHHGVTYKTAYNHYLAGKFGPVDDVNRDSTGHILVPIEFIMGPRSNDVVIYATVPTNSPENLEKLEQQVTNLKSYCFARGYKIEKVIKEIASSITETREKLLEVLTDRTIKHIVVEKKSSITRFGYEYIEQMLLCDHREIEVLDATDDEDKEALKADLVKVIYNICKKLGGERLPKKKIASLIDSLVLGVAPTDDEGNTIVAKEEAVPTTIDLLRSC